MASSGIQPFSLLIKPASADCNLRCEYCFYLDRAELYPAEKVHRMSPEVMTHLVRSYLALPFPVHTFAFQGGEPLLMGEDFYRSVVQTQRRYARTPSYSNSVQTNATLMTPSLAAFFAQEHFLLGVSVDGAEAIHDLRRRDAAGAGSHARVMAALKLLQTAGVEHNILTLISQSNVREPTATYTYLRDTLRTNFHQYIECVEFLPDGSLAPYAITAQQWGDFLCELFDLWYAHDTHTVSVRLFDSLLAKMLTGEIHACPLGTDCRQYLVVEHNGDIYPCDFYVRPELKLGNILENDWHQIFTNPLYTAFGARKRTLPAECMTCPHCDLCAGDCPKNRVGHNVASNPATLSYLCPAWKQFFDHARPRLEKLANTLRSRK